MQKQKRRDVWLDNLLAAILMAAKVIANVSSGKTDFFSDNVNQMIINVNSK